MVTQLYLSASSDAIDAAVVPKNRAVEAFLRERGIPPKEVGAIGDSVNDLPFLTLPGLALCAAPANAQPEVLSYVRNASNGIALQERVTAGFLHFYRVAGELGLSHVFVDRDGVLIWKGETELHRLALIDVFRAMGAQSRPFVLVLTGSSYEQNVAFMNRYGLDSGLRSNPAVSANPYVLWIENGALQVNVLDHTARLVGDVEEELLAMLKGPFERKVVEILDRQVLPRFALTWSHSSSDQDSRVFVPPKRTMFTVNVPQTYADEDDFRQSSAGDAFREAVLATMKQVAEDLSVPYVVLGVPSPAVSNKAMKPPPVDG